MLSINSATHRQRSRVTRGLVSLLACAGLLAGCGFADATERPYTPANGVNANPKDSDVAVLGGVVVSTEPGSGTFIASLSNKSVSDDITFTSIVGAAEDAAVTASEVKPVQLIHEGYVNLAEAGGVKLTGDFKAGDFIRLTLGFSNQDRVTIHVPVVPNASNYAGLDGPAPTDTPTSEDTSG